jgi:general stress protein 26
MLTTSQLHFFKQKIYDLNTALFQNESSSVLKIPNNIVSILNVDDIGQLWFFLKRPVQHISEFENFFYAHLHFLRKGRDFFLKVDGKAYLVTDPEEINALSDFSDIIKEKAMKEELLVKVKVCNIAYYETGKTETSNWFQQFSSLVTSLLHTRRPAYRLYRLEPDPGF